jgi:hypothetical protein
MLRHIKTMSLSMAALRFMPNSTAKWTFTPRRQFGKLFQIQRHRLNDSLSSRFAFIWGKTSSPQTKEKGSNSECSSNKHDLFITTWTSFTACNLTPLTGKWCCIPRMFQIWACKQVMDIAPANGNCPWKQNLRPLCPSCAQFNKTCSHILFCNHVGQVDALMKSIDLLEQWLEEADTDPVLHECIVEYARVRGQQAMMDICRGMDFQYTKMAVKQDAIGWRRFMERMVCRSIRGIQETYTTMEGSNLSPTQWTIGVITKLLEATHGQWLYRCVKSTTD